jgi:hypothetical protein
VGGKNVTGHIGLYDGLVRPPSSLLKPAAAGRAGFDIFWNTAPLPTI